MRDIIMWASGCGIGLVAAAGCQPPEAEKPVNQTREMRIMGVLKDYGDRDFRDRVDMNQLQQMVQEDWQAQQASLLEQRAEIESWAQESLGKWKDSQAIYGAELERQLGENQKLIQENSPSGSSLDSALKDAGWMVKKEP